MAKFYFLMAFFAAFLAFTGSVEAKASIVYIPATGTIEIKGPGERVTLTIVNSALNNKALIERLKPAEWLLKANLKTFEGVTLELKGETAGGDVNWLKLESGPAGFIAVESSNGDIVIENTKITSWDSTKGDFDKKFLDGSGRAFIAAKNRSSLYENRMDVINSEIAYLGFFGETAYGISWKVISEAGKDNRAILGKGMTGVISGSKFHHNYFGIYVWGTGNMEVRNNEIYENYRYGFDAHTQTQKIILENNFSHDNGWHGIIFADRSIGNIIRNNKVVNNKGHGIMLHEFSDGNIIELNTVIGGDDGIPLFESSNNTVIDNTIKGATNGVRIYGRAGLSRANLFENNEILESANNGIYLYEGAEGNTFLDNKIFSNGGNGVYLTSASGNIFIKNRIEGNENGVQIDYGRLREFSQNNKWEDNAISGNSRFGFLIYSPQEANDVQKNNFSNNKSGDIHYPDPAGSGLTIRLAKQSPFIFIGIILAIIAISILTALISNKL